jgi:formylglycine-generating enzyme required for sulfatase activity
MVLIPAGTFQMGSADGGEFESPVHDVYVDDFWMDEAPVTNRQFTRFVRETGHRTTAESEGGAWGYRDGEFGVIAGLSWRTYATPDRELHPAVLVSWHDSAAYCDWAKKRLPTEAEWEKAARGGLDGRLYPWGEDTPNGNQSNFARNPSEVPPTTAVTQFDPNTYGLFDMVGNVWQWCADWYAGTYYGMAPLGNPAGPAEGSTKVRRGGSWNVIQPFRLRCANRGAAPPDKCAPNMGFRCVCSWKGRSMR